MSGIDHPYTSRGGRRGPWCRQARGYSLAEVLVVLVIISLMSTIALLSYANFRSGAAAESSARMVQRLLVQGRSNAIHLNVPHQVVFDLDNSTVWIDRFNSDFSDMTPKVVAETPLAEFVLIDELRIGSATHTSGIHPVVFEPDSRNPLVVVQLRREGDDPDDDKSYYSVRLYPMSGEAQLLPRRRL